MDSEAAPLSLRADDEFNAVWRFRVPFWLYPDGSFEIGDPGQRHGEIEAPRRHAVRSLAEMLKEVSRAECEGQFVFHPEIGVIEQWPVDKEELQAPEWIDAAISERLRAAVISHYERLGPAAPESERPELPPLASSETPSGRHGLEALEPALEGAI